MADPELNILSLFSGAAGLDQGVHLALERMGHACRTVAYVEIEAHCCELLATRSEELHLDAAPVWTDISTFPARKFRGLVDLVIGGFPCPDLSVAGKRAGIHGKKSGLWFEMYRVIREIQPAMVYAENVSGLLTDGNMDAVVCGLAEIGYVGQWTSIRASDVGAPHRRERVFILAYRDGDHRQCTDQRESNTGADGGNDAAGESRTVGNTKSIDRRREQQKGGTQCGRAGLAGADTELADARQPGSQGHKSNIVSGQGGADEGRAVAELCGAPFPPGPNEHDAWADIIEAAPWLAPALGEPKRLNPRFVEWLMGWPIGWTEMIDDQSMSEIDKAMTDRAFRLRATGNGVVPQQAAAAFIELLERVP